VLLTVLQCELEGEQELGGCWDGRPFGHNRHGPKRWGCCAPFSREVGLHLTQFRLGRGLRPYQYWHLDPSTFGNNTPSLQTERTMVPWQMANRFTYNSRSKTFSSSLQSQTALLPFTWRPRVANSW